MRDILELPKAYQRYITNLKTELLNVHEISAEHMQETAKETAEVPEEARNTLQFEEYINSIERKVETKGNEYLASVFSDLVVGGESKWADVPVGAFLEWGTGPIGESTNTYKHGYPYTTIEPWDWHTWLQFIEEGSWGIRARPHMYPAFMMSMADFSVRISRAVKNAWNK